MTGYDRRPAGLVLEVGVSGGARRTTRTGGAVHERQRILGILGASGALASMNVELLRPAFDADACCGLYCRRGSLVQVAMRSRCCMKWSPRQRRIAVEQLGVVAMLDTYWRLRCCVRVPRDARRVSCCWRRRSACLLSSSGRWAGASSAAGRRAIQAARSGSSSSADRG